MDKVKSKEEIISEVFDRDEFCMADIPIMDYQKDAVYAAMETYATQQSRIDAINFYNWIENENTIWHNEQEEPLTDDELYELYQSQKPKQ